eukprot:TRINITY_DN31226_c0_g1_i1.p1 TRINITY_DN31226_c0_g1~~TRINITY_DN31226_c0_g1_i1.p1  ORF type:complete len:572 (+),score=151.27 TRINITY_DN31226_c0_g1_i1:508-2223(+)
MLPTGAAWACLVALLHLAVPAAAQPPSRNTTTAWCSTNARCREDGDPMGYCDFDHLVCECSAGYGPLLVEGEWRWFGCYPEVRQARVILTFGGQCAEDGSLPADVKSGLISLVGESAKGTVTDFSHACETLTVVLTVGVMAANIDAVQPATLEPVLQDALVAAGPVLTDQLGMTVSVSSSADPSILPLPPAPIGLTNAPSTPAPTTAGPMECTTAPNAYTAFAIMLPSGWYCQPTRCITGFVLVQRAGGQNSTGFTCTESSAEAPCVVSGDCTWDALKVLCESGVCLEPIYPTKSTPTVVMPRSVDPDVCITDSDCQTSGDSAAVCVEGAGQGNYCTCGQGFEVASANLFVCVPEVATTVRLTFSTLFPDASCANFTVPVEDALKGIIADILGEVQQAIDSCGSVSVGGVVQALRTNAENYASGTSSLANDIRVGIAASGNTGLQSLGTVANARLSVAMTACASPGALETFLDDEDRCQAVTCETGTRSQVNNIYVCLGTGAPSTPAPSDDDDLSGAGIAAIVIGAVFVASAAILAVIYFVGKTFQVGPAALEEEQAGHPEQATHQPDVVV